MRVIVDTARVGLLTAALALGSLSDARAQDPAAQSGTKPSLEVYGYAMLDIGHDFTQIDPNWFDTMRVTKLPSFEDEFGRDHNTFAGVRQSRVGLKASLPTALGELKTTFEFDLFGTGVNEGQTTFRLRHAYGELGAFGGGQTWSPFMDPDVSPKSLEFQGPTGIISFRNVQFRWTPIKGDSTVMVAVERPGADGDQGVYAERIQLQNVTPRFPSPDFSGAYAYTKGWGYVRASGIVRIMNWDDLVDDAIDLTGDDLGWGLSFSSNLKPGKKDVIRLQFTFGEGIQNYMTDAPADVGVVPNFQDPSRPLLGEALPIVGIVAFLEHTWNEKFSSTVGYSRTDIENTEGQAPNAYKAGQYALGNLLYYPVPNVMVGGEFQWGRRENFSDGFHSDGFKVQCSFKFNFSQKFGG